MRVFKQVDVFSSQRYGGNPVAVVLEAESLSSSQMQRFATWMNLSETTFIFPPKSPEADYALRIFTNTRELPFAGHPTLGSCHAWLEHGGVPQDSSGRFIVQECSHGLIRIRRDFLTTSTDSHHHHGSSSAPQQEQGVEEMITTLAFQAPPLTRTGPLDTTELASITAALGLQDTDIFGHAWCVNGPEWRGLLLKSAAHVLAVVANQTLLGDKDVGIIGPHLYDAAESNHSSEEDHFDFEVRAFCPLDSPFEDPATGSLNAGLAQWLLAEEGLVRGVGEGYVVRQGTAVGRQGQIRVMVEKHHVTNDDNDDHEQVEDIVWIGGACKTCISGMASFD